MKKSGLVVLSIALFAFGCARKDVDDSDYGHNESEVKGGRGYGGTLRVNETEPFQTLYPYAITDIVSASIANQIYEGLVRFNPKTLKVEPSIAESWTLDESGRIYTFNLRKGVMFQNDPCFPQGKGREVKASDFKFSFETLSTQSSDNYSFGSTFKDRVVGANKYYEASAKGKPVFELEGVKAINDYTLSITLESPSVTFLEILASPFCSVIAKESIEQYGNATKVGTGPFRYVDSKNTSEKIYLVRNTNYYGVDSFGNKLPFLDTVIVNFIPTKKGELDAFKEGRLDIVYGLPSESVNDFLSKQISEFEKNPPKYVLDRTSEMSTQYYEFNLTRDVLKNVKVRQAINYAIDKDKIVSEVLKNQAYGPGIYGVTPPSFKGYDITKIVGYDYNPERAKKLLAEAGYPNGKGFPTLKLELNSGGTKNTNVAFEIQKQLLDKLNINIDLEVVPLPKKLDDAKFGRADIFRSGWVADYPSPETFLSILYGKGVPKSLDQASYPNTSRYMNPEYDKLFEMGKTAKTSEESFKYFMEAEQLAMKDAPLVVLNYEENYKVIQARVKNYALNPLNYKNYTEVFLKKSANGKDTIAKR